MSEWQPIETAPTSTIENGEWSEVLVWNKRCRRCDIVRIGTDGTPMWGDWDIAVDADYWMPLPPPPNETQKGNV